MTSDFLQNKYTAKSIKAGHIAASLGKKAAPKARISARPLELTRDQDFLNGRHDIFDVLARHDNEKEGWDRSMNATLALLERARVLLSSAEQTIEDQGSQIKTLEDGSGICALTGLLNRRGFTKAFVKEVARTNRGFNEGGLIVIFNLENLANIESAHGKDAGETALKLIARALETEIREMDHAARIQHDEFVLLFAETSMEKALTRLQVMALRLNKLSLIWNNEEIHLSLSLGLKSFKRGERAEQIFKSASDDLSRNRKESKPLKNA
jgi:diguanylate cyclase